VLSQGNCAMQHVFLRPMTLWLLCASAIQLMKSQGHYSTGSHLSSKSRLNVKLKIILKTTPRHTCFETECIMALQGHPMSLILAPIESAYRTSYWSSIVTLVLSFRVSEIKLLYAKSHFPDPTTIPAKILGCSPWNRSVMLGSAESKYNNCKIIFEEFQPMW